MKKGKEILRSSYQIFKEECLIIEVFSGLLTLDNYKSHRLAVSLDVDFSPEYNLLVDIRSVVVTGLIHDVKAYVDFVIENGYTNAKRNTAILVATPNQNVYARELALLEGMLQNLSIFTDIDNAVKFVTTDFTGNEVENFLLDIQQQSTNIFYSESEY
ncbi:MAG: hypothetical protein JXQ69_04160 [Paludibacteraceae bacterium]|nr:hypothetical protein [Paludibacteraceae bacterium]MBN2787500.1 hypothetical protein [Paludibacteraceae bacterium]